jgi:hypothetical protein
VARAHAFQQSDLAGEVVRRRLRWQIEVIEAALDEEQRRFGLKLISPRRTRATKSATWFCMPTTSQ